jgi:hypothetical protein
MGERRGDGKRGHQTRAGKGRSLPAGETNLLLPPAGVAKIIRRFFWLDQFQVADAKEAGLSICGVLRAYPQGASVVTIHVSSTDAV